MCTYTYVYILCGVLCLTVYMYKDKINDVMALLIVFIYRLRMVLKILAGDVL